MSDHEKRAEILSKQYEFWMELRHAWYGPLMEKGTGPSDGCGEVILRMNTTQLMMFQKGWIT